MLVSFGYTSLPFWPQGKPYEAYFTDAGGISPGNDVNVSGIKVGKVTERGAGRRRRQGDASPSTATSRSATSRWSRSRPTPCSVRSRWRSRRRAAATSTVIPLGRTTTPYTLNTALQDLGQNASELDKPQVRAGAADPDRFAARRHPAAAGRARRGRQPVAQPQQARRGAGTAAGTRQEGLRHAGPAGRSGEPARHRRQPAVRGARRAPPGAEQPHRRHRRCVATAFGIRRRQPARVQARAGEAEPGDGQPARAS